MLKQGETTQIIFRIFKNDGFTPKGLDTSMKLKVVIYNSHHTVKFQGNYPQQITQVGVGVYQLSLPNSITRHFCGELKMEIAVYSEDMVLIGKEKVEMLWQKYVIGGRVYED